MKGQISLGSGWKTYVAGGLLMLSGAWTFFTTDQTIGATVFFNGLGFVGIRHKLTNTKK